jgi:hypothetical protein
MSELQIEVPIHSGFGILPSKENVKEFLQQNPCLKNKENLTLSKVGL